MLVNSVRSHVDILIHIPFKLKSIKRCSHYIKKFIDSINISENAIRLCTKLKTCTYIRRKGKMKNHSPNTSSVCKPVTCFGCI
jgi:hypothetical protein